MLVWIQAFRQIALLAGLSLQDNCVDKQKGASFRKRNSVSLCAVAVDYGDTEVLLPGMAVIGGQT